MGDEFYEFDIGAQWSGGIGISQYLGRYFDLDFTVTYGKLDYKNFNIPDSPLISRYQFEKNFLNLNSLLKFRPLRDPKTVQPFLGTGFGISNFWGTNYRITSITPRELQELPSDPKTAFQLPLQLGTDIRISEKVSATLNATYNRVFSDGIDGRGGDFDFDGRNHDDFIVYSVGLKVGVNKTNDGDQDGVPDKNDLCPDKYGTSFWGCPDSDGDTIPDNEDACPAAAGSRAQNGCPDSDQDGIPDHRDQCVQTAGTFENDGCPGDTDGDGIPDNEDACPDVVGDQSNNGCPEDADNDGIINIDDECPQEAGTEANNGCPEPEQRKLDDNVQQDLENIIESLQFNVSSSNIDPASYDELNRLAEIMQEDTELRLIIRGHTDNTGNTNANLELSVNRANAVKNYLVQQGVDAG
ncbi:MAG: OmpA family protein, partial [Chloroflexota bacterium]|nr:OmpA family protein [Chloroflexota bacterium]